MNLPVYAHMFDNVYTLFSTAGATILILALIIGLIFGVFYGIVATIRYFKKP